MTYDVAFGLDLGLVMDSFSSQTHRIIYSPLELEGTMSDLRSQTLH